ncbi:MAG: hypothetical protein K0B02_02735 [DPANN group archaeon]|nr:hypothetical protein [DPANN group archaeon]
MNKKGLFITDLDMSAINMHSVLKLAIDTIDYFKKTDDPRYEYAKETYKQIMHSDKKRQETGEIDTILHNGKRMKILTENIIGLPATYLDAIKKQVNNTIMPGFDNAINHANSKGLKSHIITMSFDYFISDIADKWSSNYYANKIKLDETHQNIESTNILVQDGISKANIIDTLIQNYTDETGELPDIHIHGDGESDMDMFRKAIKLKELGKIEQLFIYVPINGTKEALDIATNPYTIGDIDTHLINNTK